jgi:multiple sugar transport system ATP-binding protein
VTHDQTEAMGLADRIAVMEGGRIVQVDTPTAVYSRPASTFVGGFVGSPPMNFLKTHAEGGRRALGGLKLSAPVSGPVTLGFRGEDARLTEPAEGLTFTVQVAEPMGSHLLLTGRAEGTLVRIVAPSSATVRPGEVIGLGLDPARVVWMNAEDGRTLGPAL